jgi:hypothetical protein
VKLLKHTINTMGNCKSNCQSESSAIDSPVGRCACGQSIFSIVCDCIGKEAIDKSEKTIAIAVRAEGAILMHMIKQQLTAHYEQHGIIPTVQILGTGDETPSTANTLALRIHPTTLPIASPSL